MVNLNIACNTSQVPSLHSKIEYGNSRRKLINTLCDILNYLKLEAVDICFVQDSICYKKSEKLYPKKLLYHKNLFKLNFYLFPAAALASVNFRILSSLHLIFVLNNKVFLEQCKISFLLLVLETWIYSQMSNGFHSSSKIPYLNKQSNFLWSQSKITDKIFKFLTHFAPFFMPSQGLF